MEIWHHANGTKQREATYVLGVKIGLYGLVRFVFPIVPEAVDRSGVPLRLAGAGLFRWKWLFKVYAVAHYLPPGAPPEGPSADVARRLEFSYLVDIERDGFGKAAELALAELEARRLHSLALRRRLERDRRLNLGRWS